jgi:hypothetical protein
LSERSTSQAAPEAAEAEAAALEATEAAVEAAAGWGLAEAAAAA